MSAAIQAAVQTQLRAATGFDNDDVTLGNYRCLDNGSPPYAVILPGPFQTEESAYGGGVRTFWTVYVDIIARFRDDSYSEFNTAREAAMARLLKYPHLGIGAEDTTVTEGVELQYIYPKGGAEQPEFVKQRLALIVTEETNYAGEGEY